MTGDAVRPALGVVMRRVLFRVGFALWTFAAIAGCGAISEVIWACKRPEVTAISLNPCDGAMFGKETGIPFYLPKPLLIIAKNFRNIEEAGTGITPPAVIPDKFDDQGKYADLNARANFNDLSESKTEGEPKSGPRSAAPGEPGNEGVVTPRALPGDGLSPATFYTYHIVFVPDLTQKYGLKIRGGPGEIRAAMNLVNGWQFTGIGPFYMKDSSTAQNVLASGISTRLGGAAAADVIKASADLGKVLGARRSEPVGADEPQLQALVKTMAEVPFNRTPMSIPKFAQIHVYEAHLCAGQMEWREIAGLCFDRDYLGSEVVERRYAPRPAVKEGSKPEVTGDTRSGGVGGPSLASAQLAQSAVAAVFNLPNNSPALTLQGQRTAGAGVAGVPAGGVNQIQIAGQPSKEVNFIKFGGAHHDPKRPRIEARTLTGGEFLPDIGSPPNDRPPGGPPKKGEEKIENPKDKTAPDKSGKKDT